MKRLTQWYDDGKIRGVLVKDGYEENALQTIVTKIDECYAAVALLKEYEDTGLTPEQIMELKERDKPKRVVYEHGFEDSRLIYYVQRCKSCGEAYDPSEKFNFCPNCGQKLEQ